MQLAIVLSAIVPVFVWMIFFRERDGFSHDPADIWTVFITSAVVGTVLSILHVAIIVTIEDSFSYEVYGDPFSRAFVGAALTEEAIKLSVVLFMVFRHRHRIQPFDYVIYGMAAAAGFAAVENIGYVYGGSYLDRDHWLTVALMRSVTAVPGHIFDGVIMGCCLALAAAKPSSRFYLWPAAYLLPLLLHGTYNYLLFVEYEIQDLNIGGQRNLAAFCVIGATLLVAISGWIANRSADATLRRLSGLGYPRRAAQHSSRHWIQRPALRWWCWGSAGILLTIGGGLVASVLVIKTLTNPHFPFPYEYVSAALFALFYGLAFIDRARHAARS